MQEADSQITIGERVVGGGASALLVAEVAQAHDGSLGLAHSFIDAAADAGADAVKFQTHIAAAESTLDEPFRVRFSDQDQTRYEYWKRMEFTEAQWEGLCRHAADAKLTFLSSAFSLAAVELLTRIGVPAWKVGSGEYKSRELFSAMVATGKPILLSTGMSTFAEISEGVDLVRGEGCAIALLQCTSKYPTSLHEVGLNVIDELRDRYACPVGLSDHSGQPWPGIAALARGADLIEAHLTFDRLMFGPDTAASLTVAEFRKLREARDAFATMDAHPVEKDAAAEGLGEMRRLFTKSVAPQRRLTRGTTLTAEMLAVKKPGSGIPANLLETLIGRTLKRDVQPDRVLVWDDIDG